jgi:hypothetical protein
VEVVINGDQVEKKYAGFIKTPNSGWWLSLSKAIYDAWDLPEGPIRDGILSVAQDRGVLHMLGPSTMTSMEAWQKAEQIMGVDKHADPASYGYFQPLTDRGRDFINGTGEFSPKEEQ